MSDIRELNGVPTDGVIANENVPAGDVHEQIAQTHAVAADEAAGDTPDVVPAEVNGTAHDESSRHAEAGRKGAHRVHELIRQGLLYEQEHGLKSGRQRLRQLIELGKVYEEEHGIRPARTRKRRERLSRMEREVVLETFLQCLLRIAKPSFRKELARLAEAVMPEQPKGQAA